MHRLLIGSFLISVLFVAASAEQQPRSAKAFFTRAAERYSHNDVDGAIADYNKAIELNSQMADAYNNRGSAWLLKGNTEQAVADFSTAISIDPDFSEAYYNRGYVRESEG